MVFSVFKIYYIWDWTLNLFSQMFIHVNTKFFIKSKTIHTNQSEADSCLACENEGDVKYLEICIANNYKTKQWSVMKWTI